MVDSQSFAVRVEKLREYLKILRDIQRASRSQFLTDYHVYGLAERYLQLAIECLLDIGSMLIIQYNFPKPSVKQEIIDILREEGVLPMNFADQLSGIAGFRNILIHDYVKIDRKRVYEYLQKNLPQFETFLRHVIRYTRRHA